MVAGAELLGKESLAGVDGQDVVGEGGLDARVPVVESETHHKVTARLQHTVAPNKSTDLEMKEGWNALCNIYEVTTCLLLCCTSFPIWGAPHDDVLNMTTHRSS